MRVVCLMGPTAVGKSEMAVAAALKFGGEIVNADSMQVFKYLAIGTAAPTREQLTAVPHHLYGFLEPDQEPDAGMYARLAAAKIEDIARRGRIPIITGGTFFWMRALFDGLSLIPAVPVEVRKRIREAMSRLGPVVMHERLAAVDPVTASRLRPKDTQRIERALEVFEATGTPLSAFQARERKPAINAEVLRVAINLPRNELYRRIDERAERMFANGLVSEVKAVLGMGFSPDIRPLRAATLRPVVEHIFGLIDEPAARARVSQGHRNYAKRQLTWLRSEKITHYIEGNNFQGLLEVIEAFLC